MIYLLFEQEFATGRVTLISPHATFDGVHEQLKEIRDYWSNAGYPTQINNNGSVFVKERSGAPKWLFYVVSRHIEK